MLVGDHLQLRAIERNDLPTMVRWRNDPAIYRCFFEHEPLSLVKQETWFERLLRKDDEWVWLGETRREHDVIGILGLSKIHWRSRRAEIGPLMVSPEHRRHGYGREMCELALNYAFGHLNLHRVYAEVFADNQPAIALFEHLGFQRDGCLRHHTFAEGRYRDVLVLAKVQAETTVPDGGTRHNHG
jgi:UDP-4-amino-4,6-dideoxy-N-acetyl-beta-L-altrosamine N-acetyltransferase